MVSASSTSVVSTAPLHVLGSMLPVLPASLQAQSGFSQVSRLLEMLDELMREDNGQQPQAGVILGKPGYCHSAWS